MHLWQKQNGMVNGLPVYDLGGGRSQFGDVVRQSVDMADGDLQMSSMREMIQQYHGLRIVIGHFGMEKLMWGSDYPRTMTAITYRMSWDFIQKSSDLTAEEKQLFLHDNAKGFYGFDNLPEMPYIHHMAE